MAECVHGLTTGCTYCSDVRPAGAPAIVYVTFGGNEFHAQPDCPYRLQGQESAADRDDRVHAVRGLGWIECGRRHLSHRVTSAMSPPRPNARASSASPPSVARRNAGVRRPAFGTPLQCVRQWHPTALEPVGVDRDRDGLRTYRHVSCPG